jgi:hypothetical protein
MPSIILATKLVWVSILVALAPKADADTLNVPDAVHPTIQAAIAAASTGDTIMVGARWNLCREPSYQQTVDTTVSECS